MTPSNSSSTASQENPIITATELKNCLKSVTLVDVREPEEYAVSHIEGCQLIPLGELQQRAETELDRKANIVLYCAHGMRSMNGLVALRRMGFQNLKSLAGGIAAWEELNGPSHPSR